VAGYSDLSARGSAASGMKRGGDPSAPPDDLDPSAPAADDQEAPPDSQEDVAMQAALDAIDQGAEVYGDQVAQEIRAHINCIRELVTQGESGNAEDQPPDDGSAPPESPADQSTQGMESQTPATATPDAGGGFMM
jgi:hypothetical protein